jgi:hypothetical protein
MNKRHTLVGAAFAAAFLLTGACATSRPYPYWADIGRDWGCDPLTVQRENIDYTHERRRTPGPVEIQIGWNACEMLARAGEPVDVTGVFTTGQLAYSVLYRDSSGQPPQRVMLEQDRKDTWRVTAVSY